MALIALLKWAIVSESLCRSLLSRSVLGAIFDSDWQCHKVLQSITGRFVIDHKENVFLVYHKIVYD